MSTMTADPTLPPIPDVLTIAVAAAERVHERFPGLVDSVWFDGLDVGWSVHAEMAVPFYVHVRPRLHRMPVSA